MNSYTYAVCPHCEHPNIHVHDGRLATHTLHLGTSVECIGSGTDAYNTHAEPFRRGTLEYMNALKTAQSCILPFNHQEHARPAFTTWMFSGLMFIAVPGDRESFHIMDATGANYGAWMSVDEFRKRQKSGVIADWQSLGRAHLQIVPNRI